MGRIGRTIGASALAASSLALVGAPGARAAGVLDQHFESTASSLSSDDSYTAFMQTFTAGRSGELDQVSVLLSQDGSLSMLAAFVFDLEGIVDPSEEDLLAPIAGGIVPGEEVSSEGPAWVDVDLEELGIPVVSEEIPALDGQVVAGEEYGLVVVALDDSLDVTSAAEPLALLASGEAATARPMVLEDGARALEDDSMLTWWGDPDGDYAGGEAFVLSLYEELLWMPVGGDLSFRTYVDTDGFGGTSHAAIDGFGDWLATLCEDGGPWWCAFID